MKHNTLILGLGSEILHDDGLPGKLVKELASRGPFKKCDLKTENIVGIDLLDIINGYKRVIIIDTMKTRQGIPGNVELIDIRDIKRTMHLTEFHNVSFSTIMSLGEMLDYNMPKQVHIIAIEIVEDKTFNLEISHRLQKRYETIVDRVVYIVGNILKGKYQEEHLE